MGVDEPRSPAQELDGSAVAVTRLGQRSELTRLRDTDADGRADEYLTHAKGWGVTGNYHEYAYGPAVDKAGNMWVALNCSIGKGSNPNNQWRGWSLRVKPDGSWSPMSGGFRSPSGIGTNLAGEVFATDQQGNWYATCPLMHVKRGAFHGHADALQFTKLPAATFQVKQPLPKNLTVAEAAKRIPAYQLPTVWFPYRKMGMSTTTTMTRPAGTHNSDNNNADDDNNTSHNHILNNS